MQFAPTSLASGMMIEWKTKTIGDLPIAIIDGDRSVRYPKRSEFVQHGIPFLNTTNIRDNRLVLDSIYNYVSPEKFDEITKGRVQANDILMTTRGANLGTFALFESAHKTALINAQMLIIRPDSQQIDPHFLYYLLIGPDAQQKLSGYRTGSAQPQLPIRDLRRIPVRIPDSITVQREIATTLGTLDQKIDFNRRMSGTLEAMARRLFQSWFVDFDPVRAKIDGQRPPCLDNTTATLFPDQFVHFDEELCPKGWQISPLSVDISLERGVEPGRSACNNDGVGKRFIRVGDVTGKRGSDLFTTLETGIYANVGDVLVTFDGTPGAVSFTSQGVYSSGIRKLEGRKKDMHPCYLWCLARSEAFQQTIAEYAIGTTILHASSAIPHLRRVVPSNDVMSAFVRVVQPIWDRLLNLHQESRTLIELRDTLLPKLVSGELRTPTIHKSTS